jgi:hypothetical protein
MQSPTGTPDEKMGKLLHPHLPSHTIPWIKAQRMFWVATAPSSSSGRVNISPKMNEGTFHIIDEKRVWYEDLTGSGSSCHFFCACVLLI